MSKLITENEALIWASGHFLCEHFPEDFINWEEEQVDRFILDNVWQPFEGYSAEDVWENIDNLAYDFKQSVNNKLKEVSDEI
tara:strand:+ start:346 stop:591 length:246 start_codon:yes stop_codon:yes gene_type:complete